MRNVFHLQTWVRDASNLNSWFLFLHYDLFVILAVATTDAMLNSIHTILPNLSCLGVNSIFFFFNLWILNWTTEKSFCKHSNFICKISFEWIILFWHCYCDKSIFPRSLLVVSMLVVWRLISFGTTLGKDKPKLDSAICSGIYNYLAHSVLTGWDKCTFIRIETYITITSPSSKICHFKILIDLQTVLATSSCLFAIWHLHCLLAWCLF